MRFSKNMILALLFVAAAASLSLRAEALTVFSDDQSSLDEANCANLPKVLNGPMSGVPSHWYQPLASRIVEGNAYVLVFKHPKSKRWVAWKAVVDRYSGGTNAKAAIYPVGQSFFEKCVVEYEETKWVSTSSLMYCDEAKRFLQEKNDLGYQWKYLCDS